MKPDLIKISQHPEYAKEAARWFAGKWKIPVGEYEKSIQDCISQKTGIPQWYLVLNKDGGIIGGAGVIENDFHMRKDLTPNLCALFVEKEYRRQGIARNLLDFARKDVGTMGFDKLYLITDHVDFYEKCGWNFLMMVTENDGNQTRMYEAICGLHLE